MKILTIMSVRSSMIKVSTIHEFFSLIFTKIECWPVFKQEPNSLLLRLLGGGDVGEDGGRGDALLERQSRGKQTRLVEGHGAPRREGLVQVHVVERVGRGPSGMCGSSGGRAPRKGSGFDVSVTAGRAVDAVWSWRINLSQKTKKITMNYWK